MSLKVVIFTLTDVDTLGKVTTERDRCIIGSRATVSGELVKEANNIFCEERYTDDLLETLARLDELGVLLLEIPGESLEQVKRYWADEEYFTKYLRRLVKRELQQRAKIDLKP